LIRCKTVTKTVIRKHGRRRDKASVKTTTCRAKRVTANIKLRGTARALATLRRGRLAYATGTSVSTGRGRMRVLVTELRPLRRGRYTLVLRRRHRHRWIVRRMTIMLA
jgi:hypothetical protein